MKTIARKALVLLAFAFGKAHAQSWPQPIPPSPATQSQALAYCNEARAYAIYNGLLASSCFLASMNYGSVFQPLPATYSPGDFSYEFNAYLYNGEWDGYGGTGAVFSLTSPTDTYPGKNFGGSPGCGCGGEGGGKAPAMVGDPINVSTGNSYVEEEDFRSGDWLVLRRFYNSQPGVAGGAMGALWRHSFDRKLNFFGKPISTIVLLRPDGIEETFTKVNGAWSPQADNPDTLTEVDSSSGSATGYQVFVAALRHTETYNTNGLLVSVTDQTGQGITLNYGGAPNYLLLSVTDPSGRQLLFTYDAGTNLAEVALPDGGSLVYGHDAQTGNLTSVTYPDGKVKTYVYNEPSLTGGASFPNALTGIVDESGARYESTSC